MFVSMSLNLKIVSPEKVVYEGPVERIVVPGTSGEFEILVNHAPIISTLEKGRLVFHDSEGQHELMVNGGFVEVQKNNVNICVEL